MMREFDLDSPLVCEGIIGDGCGGGRIFFVEEGNLLVYDPLTQEQIVLLEKLPQVHKIVKKSCLITLFCETQEIVYDLSAMQIVN